MESSRFFSSSAFIFPEDTEIDEELGDNIRVRINPLIHQ